MIGGFCRNRKLFEAKALFFKMKESGCMPNVHTYTVMINGYCRIGELNEANELFNEMQESGCLPDGCTYNTIIQGFLLHNEISKAFHFIDKMRSIGFDLDAYTEALLLRFQTCGQLGHSSQKVLTSLSQDHCDGTLNECYS